MEKEIKSIIIELKETEDSCFFEREYSIEEFNEEAFGDVVRKAWEVNEMKPYYHFHEKLIGKRFEEFMPISEEKYNTLRQDLQVDIDMETNDKFFEFCEKFEAEAKLKGTTEIIKNIKKISEGEFEISYSVTDEDGNLYEGFDSDFENENYTIDFQHMIIKESEQEFCL